MTRRSLRRRLASPSLTAAAALGLAALLTACGSAGATTASSTASDSTAPSATVAGTGTDLSTVTLRVGETGWKQQELLLESAGLGNTPYRTEFSLFQGGNLQLEALGADAIDLASASEIPPIFAAQSGGPGSLTISAVRQGNTLTQEVVVPEGSDITSVDQLKGRKVAYVQNTTAHHFLYQSLADAGLQWSDIEAVPLSTSDGLAALLSGQVDALASYGTAIITAHAKGATTLVDARDILSGNFLYVTRPATNADPATKAAILDFYGRLEQAYAWARAHPDEWAAVIARETKQPVDQARQVFVDGEQQRPSHFVPTSPEAIASQQKIVDTFVEAGILTSTVDIGQYWTTEYDLGVAAIQAASDVG